MTNQKFGRLTAVRATEKRRGPSVVWECECSCGELTEVASDDLRRGNSKSCGCLQREVAATNNLKHGHSSRRKGQSRTYLSRRAAIARCTNPNNNRYANYGGRAITVCSRWQGERGFENFLADMGECPSSQHSLGRILDLGNYEPGNVFWMTRAEQSLAARNKRALLKWHDSQVLRRNTEQANDRREPCQSVKSHENIGEGVCA